jgi:D-inositol-3-phosphate glycosyltransferase
LKYYYSAADIFVTTPWYEPFGITPLEAMACGVPVIGSNVGGIKYSITPGVTGHLVEPNHPAELADCIDRMLAQPAVLENMKKNCLYRVRRLFTWAKVSSSIAEYYHGIIQSLRQTGAAESGTLARVISFEYPAARKRRSVNSQK